MSDQAAEVPVNVQPAAQNNGNQEQQQGQWGGMIRMVLMYFLISQLIGFFFNGQKNITKQDIK